MFSYTFMLSWYWKTKWHWFTLNELSAFLKIFKCFQFLHLHFPKNSPCMNPVKSFLIKSLCQYKKWEIFLEQRDDMTTYFSNRENWREENVSEEFTEHLENSMWFIKNFKYFQYISSIFNFTHDSLIRAIEIQWWYLPTEYLIIHTLISDNMHNAQKMLYQSRLWIYQSYTTPARTNSNSRQKWN